MLLKRLKVAILLLLLVGWMGREIHTHSEKEFRTAASHSTYASQEDVKHSPPCPICQFQRNVSSLWNPDFLVRNSSLLLVKENITSSNVLIVSLTVYQIQLGRAPPLLFTI
ncbi:hypothetical protein A0128_04570 [Leptospira tipperaryensis]|uniref:Uncharacterized protein n=1 Tax=Leptospira tipperaryensis TaxID=2564040 RepID=A0A1D7UUA6_9LEPT|nr:hypothetical protein [Leptospira tipperaryensis]AOP33192.1 hypothetical protein A0128_04570 [Leptospira tipperaryensis]